MDKNLPRQTFQYLIVSTSIRQEAFFRALREISRYFSKIGRPSKYSVFRNRIYLVNETIYVEHIFEAEPLALQTFLYDKAQEVSVIQFHNKSIKLVLIIL